MSEAIKQNELTSTNIKYFPIEFIVEYVKYDYASIETFKHCIYIQRRHQTVKFTLQQKFIIRSDCFI